MGERKIYYLGFYDRAGAKYKRNYVLAATTKMDYIAQSIVSKGLNVDIISASVIVEKRRVFTKGEKRIIEHGITLTTLLSFGTRTKMGMRMKMVFILFVVFFKLLAIKRNATLLVYHSPWLSLPVRMAKRVKNFRLILEIEEIYADITSLGKLFDKMEYALINAADCYLLSTDLLKQKVSSAKPSVVIYGRYKIEPQLAKPVDDGKVRLLYGGVIDKKKAGAFNALYASQYLDDRYELHIIGFGEIELLKQEIEELNKKNSCKVYYDGLLSGDEYIAYCQQCHVGLSTQKMEGKYIESSFPSKILSYLSMGLNVVSGRIKCVEVSQIGKMVTYYDDDTPQSIAAAIISLKFRQTEEILTLIKMQNENFIDSLNKLL